MNFFRTVGNWFVRAVLRRKLDAKPATYKALLKRAKKLHKQQAKKQNLLPPRFFTMRKNWRLITRSGKDISGPLSACGCVVTVTYIICFLLLRPFTLIEEVWALVVSICAVSGIVVAPYLMARLSWKKPPQLATTSKPDHSTLIRFYLQHEIACERDAQLGKEAANTLALDKINAALERNRAHEKRIKLQISQYTTRSAPVMLLVALTRTEKRIAMLELARVNMEAHRAQITVFFDELDRVFQTEIETSLHELALTEEDERLEGEALTVVADAHLAIITSVQQIEERLHALRETLLEAYQHSNLELIDRPSAPDDTKDAIFEQVTSRLAKLPLILPEFTK